MFTMKTAAQEVGMSYETLRFYCDTGLVPNVARDKNNYRIFSQNNINWLKGLQKLKKCGMSIKDMKHYMNLCLEGISSIDERKAMLDEQRKALVKKLDEIHDCLDFIDDKQEFYDGVLDGRVPYISNLVASGT